jgi:P-type E1-E2 ATPase
MLKEGYEDYQRYKSDKEMNNKLTKVLNFREQIEMPSNSESAASLNSAVSGSRKSRQYDVSWGVKKWQNLAPGDIVKLESDFEAPADIMIMCSSNKSGVVFVDTMNLDGETYLKERHAISDLISEDNVNKTRGEIFCEAPSENLEKWEA